MSCASKLRGRRTSVGQPPDIDVFPVKRDWSLISAADLRQHGGLLFRVREYAVSSRIAARFQITVCCPICKHVLAYDHQQDPDKFIAQFDYAKLWCDCTEAN